VVSSHEVLRRHRPVWRAVRILGGVVAVVIGLVVTAGTYMLGSCDAFGGRCGPDERASDDVVGGLAFGLALLVAGPILAALPDRRGLGLAVVAGCVAAAVGAAVGASGY